MDIIQKFLNLQEGKTLVFPRYHQLDVVRKLLADVKKNGLGRNYLIQHSAGSGKSNSIAWTAYRLASLFNADNKPVFSSVIVVTDRTVLDAQLQETISGFDHTLGAVAVSYTHLDVYKRQIGSESKRPSKRKLNLVSWEDLLRDFQKSAMVPVFHCFAYTCCTASF